MNTETLTTFSNFSLETNFPSLEELKNLNYVGFGAIGIILNEHDEILLIKESSAREGQEKQGRWSLIYETGKVGETPDLTMISGLGSELGHKLISKLKSLKDRSFGFDFRRYNGDKPSRSLIAMYYLETANLSDATHWGNEVSEIKWIKPTDLLMMEGHELRINVKAIVKELNERKLLSTIDASLVELDIPQKYSEEYLVERENILDLFWK